VRPYFKKIIKKKGLVEWLKVEALSSSLSTEKRKKFGFCSVGCKDLFFLLKTKNQNRA
jgi:hypothetical protein